MKIVDNRPSSKIEQLEVMNKPANDSVLGTKSIPLLYLRFALAGIMANVILGVVAVVDGYFVSDFQELEVEGSELDLRSWLLHVCLAFFLV